ncbi:alpha/beta fold hydrolase [Micromonospora inyonensis]|uniref:alpha/beta fold hydrolase n=1 Tax=Micromonospora inyonensis TaxID=47866 RepID=UPI000A936180|nr:alpha/beta fold hydrolase [Micromonospora inyonensis]
MPHLRTTDHVVPFQADDGRPLNLVNVRGDRPPSRGPVLLVHGAGVSAEIFRAPIRTTLVDALIAAGYDVWLENWRASTALPPCEWTLDQAARHDHPAAVRTVVTRTGADRIKAVIHCQGSTSFMMSACAGLVGQVDTIVASAVSLHTVVPAWSRAKLRWAVPVVRRFLEYLDPSWGRVRPDEPLARLLTALVRLTHHECDNLVCKMVSFTYGSGFPALWRHENLNAATHDEFIPYEFGKVSMAFFRQMARCVERGHLVSYERLPGLPEDYLRQPPRTDARIVFIAGERNRCFLPESQIRTHALFSRRDPGRHALHVLPDYGHLDLFFGQDADRDVFPLILRELAAPIHV